MTFSYVKDTSALGEGLERLKSARFLFLDIETTSASEDFTKNRVRLVQMGDFETTLVVDLFKCPGCAELLKPFLSERAWVGHNLKFDVKHLYYFFGIEPATVFDTYVASILLGNERNSLQAVVERYLGEFLDKSEQLSNWGAEELTEAQLAYAAKDVEILRRLYPILLKDLNAQSAHADLAARTLVGEIFGLKNAVAAIEMAMVKETAKLEARGIAVDRQELSKLLKEFKKKLQEEQIEFMSRFGKYDPFSPKQVAFLLTKRLKLELPSTKKGNVATDDRALAKHANEPAVAKILNIRRLKKIYDKLVEINKFLRADGRVHPEFKQIGTKTGRMSSNSPNVQNVPRSLRKVFVAAEGKKLVIADFSQIELRIAAEFVGEERMIEAFERGEDLHALTASLVLGKPKDEITKEERQLAKAMNYGLIYGISARGLMEYARSGYGVELSPSEAAKLIGRFFKAFPSFARWHEKIKEELAQKGRVEGETILGRRFVAETFQDAANYPIQGSGADLLKLAVNVFAHQCRLRGWDEGVVNLVHDEIVCEVEAERAEDTALLLKESMEFAGSLMLKRVPVEAEVAVSDRWEK